MRTLAQAPHLRDCRTIAATHPRQHIRAGVYQRHKLRRLATPAVAGAAVQRVRAAAAALRTPDSWHREQRSVVTSRRRFAEKMLRSLGCEVAAGQVGLFVWARVPERFASGYAMSDALLDETGVFLPPGEIFGTAGAGHIRLSLCTPMELIERCAERIRTSKLAA